MRIISKLALAGIALCAFTSAASATVILTGSTPLALNGPYGAGNALVWDFDGVANSNFSYSGPEFTYSSPGWVAEPATDSSGFGAGEPGVGPGNGPATFSVKPGLELTSLSVYLGSVDDYNTLSFYSGSTLVRAFGGNELTNPINNADGNQSAPDTNGRFYFTFGAADDVNRVVFSSTAPAFEFDNIAAAVSAVPEPATWAMMIIGFGFVGFTLRNGRRQVPVLLSA